MSLQRRRRRRRCHPVRAMAELDGVNDKFIMPTGSACKPIGTSAKSSARDSETD